MSNITSAKGKGLAERDVARLQALRLRLLHLHHGLLEMERVNYEKVSGRVNSGELLQLVINHAQFAWLRMISALVVQIDEMLDEDEPVLPSSVESLFTQARKLFTDSDNKEFRARYEAALQTEPGIVMAHAEVMKLLRETA
ncbi:MAG: hypothetical protein QOJ65_2153 [Fimbriimonadaceae bacterium]|jgi:hypothetical protein|nr:hypothetical protein [Fimbriimonadaceae bacterium]